MLDALPDLVLQKICLFLKAKDLTSLQKTHRKLLHHIKANRIYYDKYELSSLVLELKKDGQRQVSVTWRASIYRKGSINTTSVDDVINSTNPDVLKSYDHDELADMSPLWWNERRDIELYNIIDYRRYLPYLDKCTVLTLNNNNPMNLSEILASMQTKNLQHFSLEGNGKLECTDDDLRKIGRLSINMSFLNLANISEQSNISNDAIIDMIEIGSFANKAILTLSRLQENMLRCLDRRDWVLESRKLRGRTTIEIKKSGGVTLYLHTTVNKSERQIRTEIFKNRPVRSVNRSSNERVYPPVDIARLLAGL